VSVPCGTSDRSGPEGATAVLRPALPQLHPARRWQSLMAGSDAPDGHPRMAPSARGRYRWGRGSRSGLLGWGEVPPGVPALRTVDTGAGTRSRITQVGCPAARSSAACRRPLRIVSMRWYDQTVRHKWRVTDSPGCVMNRDRLLRRMLVAGLVGSAVALGTAVVSYETGAAAPPAAQPTDAHTVFVHSPVVGNESAPNYGALPSPAI
jgi:hypothetical protein